MLLVVMLAADSGGVNPHIIINLSMGMNLYTRRWCEDSKAFALGHSTGCCKTWCQRSGSHAPTGCFEMSITSQQQS